MIVFQRYHASVSTTPGKTPMVVVPDLPPASDSIGELLEDVAMLTAFLEVERPVRRIGVQLEARLDASSLPPGIEAFYSGLAVSVGAENLAAAECSLLKVIRDEEKALDRCHHRLSLDDEARPGDVRATLDFQRFWRTEHPYSTKWLESELVRVRDAALDYVEKFGAGEWIDE